MPTTKTNPKNSLKLPQSYLPKSLPKGREIVLSTEEKASLTQQPCYSINPSMCLLPLLHPELLL